MVDVKVFVDAALAAGETSDGVLVDLAGLGAAGYFGLEVSCDDPLTIWYEASAGDDAPGAIDGDDVLAAHPGGGKKMYAPVIGAYGNIWVYATAPSGAAVSGINVILNVW